MDLGELLFLIFIIFSVLSSVIGGKKKRGGKVPPARRRPRPQTTARPGQAGPRTIPPQPDYSPDVAPGGGGGRAASQMEEILRQLGLEVEAAKAPETAEVEMEPAPRHTERETPQVVSLEGGGETAESFAAKAELQHARFHDKYVKPLRQPSTGTRPSRGRVALNPRSLREAIILHEILGPPKGMR